MGDSLGDGQWDIPVLRVLLETIIPEKTSMDGFEFEYDFPNVGRGVMLLNARKVVYEAGISSTILLAFMDVTVRRGSSGRRKSYNSGPTNCCVRSRPYSVKCSTGSPIACRSLPACCC